MKRHGLLAGNTDLKGIAMKNDATPQETADHAVKKTFSILGVDVDDPKSVEEFRKDLRFGSQMRRASDHAWLAVYSATFIGIFVSDVGWNAFAIVEAGRSLTCA